MLEKIYGFIPQRLGNRTLLRAWELLRIWNRLRKKDFSANRAKNEEAFIRHEEVIRRNNGYVEDQNRYRDMAYGKTDMAYAG